ncbi:hypothetical protein N8T08_005607 [Aspergillus melleus]|uniref:Uncharacterized protein n=1 Tax=Aspergillus melleus TaxID=138277 RepID=A0ACC3B1G6_9EURO|nr:hypothetical protein N8T08_005607 [Aspergillus melleus]
MSGAEILGVASAALGLLEMAVTLVERVRNAHARQKELAAVLESYRHEIHMTTCIVNIVKNEEALQTAGVASSLVEINKIGVRMKEFLETLQPAERGTLRQFAHQLVRGSDDDSRLRTFMNQLIRAKLDLSLKIQVANVGLTRSVGDRMVVNVATIDRIDSLLQSTFGEGKGLKIANLINHQVPDGDNTVALGDKELGCLGSDGAGSHTTRLILNNVTLDQALQINGPVGEKGWREVSRLTIKDNCARDKSIQVNHAVSLDVFDRLLAARAATVSTANT